MTRHFPSLLPVVLLAVLAACGVRDTMPAMDSPGPALVVERFLQAANQNDLRTMAQLFGDSRRSFDQMHSAERAERQMQVLASLLRHEDYSIQGQRIVPGRINDATELLVEIKTAEQTVVVPHLVVRRRSGGWIIEQIEVERLTTRGGVVPDGARD
jgi:hypothetical protein